jgi:hypothetical protein
MRFTNIQKRFGRGIIFLFFLFGGIYEAAVHAGGVTMKPQDISREVNVIFYAYYGQYIGDKHDTTELTELKDNYLTVLITIENGGGENLKLNPEEFSVTTSYGTKLPPSEWTKTADKYLKFRALLPETVEPGQTVERYLLFKRSPKQEEPETLSTLHWNGKDYAVEPEKEPEWK